MARKPDGGFVQQRMASLGETGEPSAEAKRKRLLTDAIKQARARLYTGQQALDVLQGRLTAAMESGNTTAEVQAMFDAIQAELRPYIEAALGLPSGKHG